MLFVAGPVAVKNAESLKVLLAIESYRKVECESCFVTQNVELMVRASESKVLMRMIGHMVAEVTGKWKKVLNWEFPISLHVCRCVFVCS
jgi:predicted DNA repair protein MutK